MALFFRTVGNGQPLIILHGLFGSSDNWLTIAKSLSDNYKVILVDQRNHGKSFHSEEFHYHAMAEDVAQLIRDEGLEAPIVMGHSMGGKTAMKLATSFDVPIQKLIIVDIGPKAYPVHHHIILRGLNAIPVDSLTSRKEADEILSIHVKELGIRQFLLKNLARNEDGGFSWKINLPVITDQIAEVGEPLQDDAIFDGPSLFINGEKSDYILPADRAFIQGLFPNTEFKTVQGAGHWVHAERPQAFLQVLNEFLTQ